MVNNLINLILLTCFILSILNIVKTAFQIVPLIKSGLTYKVTSTEMFILGLSIAYTIAFIIKLFGI